MKIWHCLQIAALVFGGVLVGGVVIALLRYVLAPVGRLLMRYWDWVNDTFESEFVQFMFAMAPVVASVLALVVFFVCLLGD